MFPQIEASPFPIKDKVWVACISVDYLMAAQDYVFLLYHLMAYTHVTLLMAKKPLTQESTVKFITVSSISIDYL